MKSEIELVETYLRLNGFFTVTGSPFPEQPCPANAGPTVDITAIRLPIIEDSCAHDFWPDAELALSLDAIEVVIGDVSRDSDPAGRQLLDSRAVEKAIARFHCGLGDVALMTRTLARSGRAVSFLNGNRLRVRLVAFGSMDQFLDRRTLISMEHVTKFVDRALQRGQLEQSFMETEAATRENANRPDEPSSPAEVSKSTKETLTA